MKYAICDQCKTMKRIPKWKVRNCHACDCGNLVDIISRNDVRSISLQWLGFASYREYLGSDLWESIRSKVVNRESTCCKCGETANQVHHLNYLFQTMNGNDLSGLVPICKSCHYKIEFTLSGKKRTLGHANGALAGRWSKGNSRPEIGKAFAARRKA